MSPYLRFRVLPGNADLARVCISVATGPLISRAVEGCQFYLIALSCANLQSVASLVVDNLSEKYGSAFHINADLIPIFALVVPHANLKAPSSTLDFHRKVPDTPIASDG